MQDTLHCDKNSRRSRGDEIQAASRRHTYACGSPHARRRGQAMHGLSAINNHSRSEKADPRYDLSRDARSVVIGYIRKGIFGYDHNQRRARTYNRMRPNPCLLETEFSFKSDGETQQYRVQYPTDINNFFFQCPFDIPFFISIIPQEPVRRTQKRVFPSPLQA